jgi:hypothetical protein
MFCSRVEAELEVGNVGECSGEEGVDNDVNAGVDVGKWE